MCPLSLNFGRLGIFLSSLKKEKADGKFNNKEIYVKLLGFKYGGNLEPGFCSWMIFNQNTKIYATCEQINNWFKKKFIRLSDFVIKRKKRKVL